MRWIALLCLLGTLGAGCADPPRPVTDEAAPEPVVDPWGGADRLLILDWHAETIETDIPMCIGAGSGFDLRRTDEWILPGTDHLEITLSTADTQSGIQVGYTVDDGERTWSPAVHGDAQTFTVPVLPDQVETPERRWAFRHQMNLPEPAAQDCYTGGGSGQWDIVITAVRATA